MLSPWQKGAAHQQESCVCMIGKPVLQCAACLAFSTGKAYRCGGVGRKQRFVRLTEDQGTLHGSHSVEICSMPVGPPEQSSVEVQNCTALSVLSLGSSLRPPMQLRYSQDIHSRQQRTEQTQLCCRRSRCVLLCAK